jgi:hypothetical protein
VYRLYTYSAKTNGIVANLFVDVPGSSTTTQVVTGPMPANQFIYGVDYCAHDLVLTGSSFEIDVSGNGPPNPEVQGFQIVMVAPEPGTLTLSLLGIGWLVARKTRR